MKTLIKKITLTSTLFIALFYAGSLPMANACTRALYVGKDNLVITGRTMDWSEPMHSDIWVFPRGMKRNGEAGSKSPQWTSKYGSVVVSVYDAASADGINEKGLVMNMLYLAESGYGKPDSGHPPLAISVWGQYALDNFATVAEAVEAMQAKPFYLLVPKLPNGAEASVHLSLSDASGDSAIFEYIDGKLVIHHGKKFRVMTNSPTYSQQLALDEYWKNIGGTVFLPGTNRASDRFARTFFLIDAIPKTLDPHYIQAVPNKSYENQAVFGVLSVMRAVSVPLGITTPNQPNISSTIWRTVADQKNLVYNFDSSTRPNTFWVSLDKLNFQQGAPVLKLPLEEKGKFYSGEVAKQFKPATPFQFLSVPVR